VYTKHINILYRGRSTVGPRKITEMLMPSTFVHYFLIQALKYAVNIYLNQSLDIKLFESLKFSIT